MPLIAYGDVFTKVKYSERKKNLYDKQQLTPKKDQICAYFSDDFLVT